MSEQNNDDITDGTSENDRCVEMLNKRPRLLSFQGLSSHSRALADRDVPVPMASTSSSSLEHISRREQLANDLRSWQESQIAACIDDNILNMVLERFLVFFERRNNSSSSSAQQPSRVNDDEILEDEAVRMAISARGLLPARADELAGPSGSQSVPVAVTESNPVVEPPEQSWPEMGRAVHDNYILETAVAAAIQEKGLITGCSEGEESSDSDGSVHGEEDDAR
ncbi:uncharacterized protein LOC126559004 [Anopheles maculipalpis]|uniref:uncharacterized protein LOC126559004 n=1 Tax=Anopheles maculipalpis TaxID=1496333 RepID=UPI002158FAF0|nr:uncharacterized protein LOC126559004 [Anopheles maculipalpis]